MPKVVNSKLTIVNRKHSIHHLRFAKANESFTIHKPAFTLIELLIVIAIASILSAIGFFGYQSSQKKARDGQRKSDLTQVKKAMESAKNDCLAGTYYPDTAGSPQSEVNDFTALSTYLADSDLKYLAQTVKDPKDASPYQYTLHKPTSTTANVCTNNAGTSNSNAGIKSYVLRVKLEIDKDPDTNKSRTSCANAISQITISPAPATDDGFFYACPD